MRSVWDATIDDKARRALEPGVPDTLDRNPDVLVVGGGVIGLATAVACRESGLGSVVVLERERRLAAGPSGKAAGLLAPGLHEQAWSPSFARLARAGLERHRTLDRTWDAAIGVRPLDLLIPIAGHVPPGEWVPAGATAIDAGAVRAAEPALADVDGALLVRDQAWVHPLRLSAALARRAGAVAGGVAVDRFVRSGDRIVSVKTSIGDFSPGAVVITTGTTDRVSVAQRRVKGHLIALGPAPFRLRAALVSTILVVQLPDRRIVAGGTLDTGDDEDVVRPEVVAGIRAEVERLVPGTRGLPLDSAWCCFRPVAADEMPIMDLLPGSLNAWVSVGHYRTGLLLAPAAGEAVASWIRSGRRPRDLGAFSLAR